MQIKARIYNSVTFPPTYMTTFEDAHCTVQFLNMKSEYGCQKIFLSRNSTTDIIYCTKALLLLYCCWFPFWKEENRISFDNLYFSQFEKLESYLYKQCFLQKKISFLSFPICHDYVSALFFARKTTSNWKLLPKTIHSEYEKMEECGWNLQFNLVAFVLCFLALVWQRIKAGRFFYMQWLPVFMILP